MLIGILIIISIIGLDQGLKYLAKFLLQGKNEVTWIPHVLTFNYVENRGAAWGMLEGKHFFFFIITIIALVVFGYMFTKADFKNKKVYSLSIAFLIAGTLGNALDRLILGYVIDFIHVPFLTYILDLVGLSNFWFNIADLSLTVGVILLVIDILFFESKRTKNNEGNLLINDGMEVKERDTSKN
ncbi:MAG: signal peptidase II [Acholeplasmataceae bacterium]|jgi:signal peptidase II